MKPHSFSQKVARRIGKELTGTYGCPVQGVSIPRSGNHLVWHTMRAYDGGFRFCEFYRDPDCCKEMICRGDVHLTKSHDFALDVPIMLNRRYLIQVRPLVPTLVSHFEFGVSEGTMEDSREAWTAHALNGADYRKRFVDKWVINVPPALSRLTVHYDDLIADPLSTMNRVAGFIWRWWPPSRKRLARAIAAQKTVPGRRTDDFRYFDSAFFARLSADLADHEAVVATARTIITPPLPLQKRGCALRNLLDGKP